MAQLQPALSEFHADIARAAELLRLLKEFRNFAGSHVPDQLHDGTVTWDAALDLARVAPLVRTDLPIFSGSILLYICGRFEYFVREVVVSLADDMASTVSTYADLPDRVRDELYARTLEIAQAPGRFGYSQPEADKLLVSLAGNISGTLAGSSVTIPARVLSVTESNMTSRTLADIFKRIDITDLWTELAKQAPLKTFLSRGSDSQCRQEATSRLDALMKERNSVAHPTGTVTFPDADKVLDSSEFFKILAQVIADVALIPR